MEKSDQRETHDFMNVESFSQLPFMRPAPVKEKGIRLFGKEFGGDSTVTDESESSETNNACDQGTNKDGENAGESSRKFECHYCCRNFPTSQALGGHQNAHKRERQHAKRAHLQSAIVQGGVGGGFSEAHVYGLMNYHHRLSSASSSAPPPPLAYHHSWNAGGSYATSNTRLYGGGSHHTPTINGSPLALWRIPAVQNQNNNKTSNNLSRSIHPLPLFANHHHDMKPSPIMTGSNNNNSQTKFMYESKPSVQDHVSLDLHL